MGSRLARGALALALLASVAGCGGEAEAPPKQADAPPKRAEAPPKRAEVPPPDADARERLRALGYVDFAEGPADPAGDGVLRHDPARAAPGYDLVSYPALQRIELIDRSGRPRHVWRAAPGMSPRALWARAALLPDADLLLVTDRPPRVRRLAPDGRERWVSRAKGHHHVAPRADGSLVTLTRDERHAEGFSRPTVIDHAIALLAASGERLEERSILDMLARRPEILPLEEPEPLPEDPDVPIDLFHTNRVEWLDAGVAGSALLRAGRVLVTIRNQDSIVLFDWAQGEPVWAWGRGIVRRPHDASVLSNGHVLVFDNRTGRDGSRVIEIDPRDGRIVWSYATDPPGDFYSDTRGTAQRLANGNTLIAESNEGRAFEVTPDGEIVWEYRTPHRNEEGQRAALRIERYPESAVAALLGDPAGPEAPRGGAQRLSPRGSLANPAVLF